MIRSPFGMILVRVEIYNVRVSRLFSLPIDQNVYVTEICRHFTYLTQNLIFIYF